MKLMWKRNGMLQQIDMLMEVCARQVLFSSLSRWIPLCSEDMWDGHSLQNIILLLFKSLVSESK